MVALVSDLGIIAHFCGSLWRGGGRMIVEGGSCLGICVDFGIIDRCDLEFVVFEEKRGKAAILKGFSAL